jgi:SAM-dependent methyltransferase
LVYTIAYAAFKPHILRLALRLDVFTPLAAGPADAETLAQACHCHPFGMRALLDYLSSLGLLERQAGLYALTPTAAAFLVPARPTYAGDLLLAYLDASLWDGILQALRSGQPSGYVEPHAQDAWLESYSATRPTKSLEMWRAADIQPGGRPGLRLLDLACGCAIKSFSMAQQDPTLQVTCLDRAEVLQAARDLAGRMDILPQVTFLAGDLLSADLGQGGYDVALLGQVTFYLTPQQNAGLFRRVHRALAPGGVLVIDGIMASDPPSEWASFLTLFTWATGGGAAHAFADYRAWLEAAGFRQVTQLSERWLSAIK